MLGFAPLASTALADDKISPAVTALVTGVVAFGAVERPNVWGTIVPAPGTAWTPIAA
jgi:hypothetical protein